MKVVLITGGAGFIGTHLVKQLLSSGYRIRVLDNLAPQIHGDEPAALEWLQNPDISFHRGSVTSREDWARALDGVSYIVHLAAETGTGQSMYKISHYNEVNSQGTAILFDLLANTPNHGIERIVLASSRSVYGEGAYVCKSCDTGHRHFPGTRNASQFAEKKWEPICSGCNDALTAVPTRESDKIQPASIYASTKFAQEELVRVACDALGIGYAILRLQNVYGEGQSLNNPYTGILSIFSTRVRRGLHLPLFEDGEESRDFVHVSDVAAVFERCLAVETPINDVVNVGSGVATSVLQVASQLSSALGSKPQLEVTGEFRLGDIRHNFACINKLQEGLQYMPKISLEEGLRRFSEWVLTQPLPEDKLGQANEELKARRLMG